MDLELEMSDAAIFRCTVCVRITRAGTRLSVRCSLAKRSLCVTVPWAIRESPVRTELMSRY